MHTPSNPLGLIRSSIAHSVALGLTKKAPILANALPVINDARRRGFTHAQIREAIVSGGLDISPKYYENLYARQMRKIKKPAFRAANKIEEYDNEQQDKLNENENQTNTQVFISSDDELKRARDVSKQNFRKLSYKGK